MIFNGTLIVQIGNFLVTYWFLNAFFLKKGYAVVSAENAAFEELENRVMHCKQLAHEAVQKKEHARNAYSVVLRVNKPELDMHYFKTMHSTEKPVEFIKPMQKTISELTHLLVKRVSHD